MSAVILQKGQRAPSIVDTVSVAGTAVDLTTPNPVTGVTFSMRSRTSATLKIDHTGATITQSSPTVGRGGVRYDQTAGDVDTAGDYVGWWQVTYAGGKTQDTPEFAIYITDHVAGSADLCTREDVKQALESSKNTTARDPRIDACITAASAHIMRKLERELVPQSAGLVRTFPVSLDARHALVNLAPFDLRTPTTVRLHPEAGAGAVTLAASEYAGQPTQKPEGSYTRLQIADTSFFSSSFSLLFGYAQVEITGDWGIWTLPTLPRDIREAAAVTVRSWLRQGFGIAALTDQSPAAQGVQTEAPASFGIPSGAWQILSPLKRMF